MACIVFSLIGVSLLLCTPFFSSSDPQEYPFLVQMTSQYTEVPKVVLLNKSLNQTFPHLTLPLKIQLKIPIIKIIIIQCFLMLSNLRLHITVLKHLIKKKYKVQKIQELKNIQSCCNGLHMHEPSWMLLQNVNVNDMDVI